MAWLHTEKNLLALLINSGSADGEWRNAAAALRAKLLRRGATIEELTTAGNGCQPAAGLSKANWGAYQMPWGAHQGEMFADIDLPYLMFIQGWLLKLKDSTGLNSRNAKLFEALNNYMKCQP
jgi:hypothetical protein